VPQQGHDLLGAAHHVVRFVNEETGEIREQHVFMGDFPMMTSAVRSSSTVPSA